MYKWQKLDRDHVVDRALGGTAGPAVLAHQSCNRAAGARLGNQLRPLSLPRPGVGHDVTCPVCGKVNGRKSRKCEICGAHYHPGYSGQRTCSRPCGVAIRRRIYGPSGSSRAAKPKPLPKPRHAAEPYAPRSAVTYYTCRYCGELGIAHGTNQQRREVCPARACQLARLAANHLVARKGMTREQADAAVVAYRAEGDHRQLRSTPGQIAADRRWSQTVAAFRRATERAARDW